MAVAKSPFLVVQNFLSPKLCELIVDRLGFFTPDVNADGQPIKMQRTHDESERLIFDRFNPLIPNISQYYGFEYKGTEEMSFEFLPQESSDTHKCENSKYLRKKWVRVLDRDISCVLFLSDYNDNIPFDSEYEVYGGKLEFPQYNFGFNPQRGTLIMYPSGPHFVNANADIRYGDLYQVRFHIAASMPYLYDPRNFPGDFTSWFSHIK